MSLSMDEQRLLGEIEQRLATEDPRLATVFGRFTAAHHRRSPLSRTRPAVVSPGEPSSTRASSHPSRRRHPSASAGPGLLRRVLPWLALASGAAMLAAGVVLGQVVLALAGSVVLAATPLLFPVCGTAPSGEHLTGHRLVSRRDWLRRPFRRS